MSPTNPPHSTQRPGPKRTPLRGMLAYARSELALMAVALLTLPAAALSGLIQPYLMKRGIDAMVVNHDASALGRVVLLFVLAVTFELVTRFANLYSLQLGGQRIIANLRRDVFAHIQKLHMRFFTRTPIGRLVTRLTNDVDSIGEAFAAGGVTIITDILTLIGVIAFMFYIDARLTLVTLVALPPLALVVNWFRKRLRLAFQDVRRLLAQLNSTLAEQIGGIAEIRIFGKEAEMAAEYDAINREYRSANYRSIRYDAALFSTVDAIATCATALVLWYAGFKLGWVHDHSAAAAYIGTIVAFYEYVQRLFVPVRDLAGKYTIVQSAIAAAERVFGLLDVVDFDPAIDAHSSEGGQADAPHMSGELRFERVSFSYDPEKPVLREVSFAVGSRHTLAIVGPTGSGKSTLVALMLRLYETDAGRITLHGRDVRTWSAQTLRESFSIVPQDVYLVRGSLLDNIALGALAPDAERAEWVLREVGAWAVFAARGGLSLDVTERGGNLSAGEAQLVALARALYRDRPFLILDEATAHLDAEFERLVESARARVTAGRTTIVIAHRLQTVVRASEVVVLRKGEVVERGTHAQLLANNAFYARLFRLQQSGVELSI